MGSLRMTSASVLGTRHPPGEERRHGGRKEPVDLCRPANLMEAVAAPAIDLSRTCGVPDPDLRSARMVIAGPPVPPTARRTGLQSQLLTA